MLDAFLNTALGQLRDRLVALKSERPRRLPAEYDLASQAVSSEIDRLVTDVQELRGKHEDAVLSPTSTINEYRVLINEAIRLETGLMPALANVSKRDIQLTRLLRKLHQEIGFPLHCPAVTRSSQELYWIDGAFHLIGVPYSEDHSPLSLPVLFHELAHLLFAETNDRQVKPFEQAMISIGVAMNDYFREREIKAARRRGQGYAVSRFKAWKHFWVKNWIEELCCDAFATIVGGPAYAWAFTQSTLAFGVNPHELPHLGNDNDHPADAARVSTILNVLNRCGFSGETERLTSFWDEVQSGIGDTQEEEFLQCYPAALLDCVAEHMITASESSGCHRFTNPGGGVRAILLDYWNQSLCGEEIAEDWQRQLLDV